MKIKRSVLINLIMVNVLVMHVIKVESAYNCAIESNPNVLTTYFQIDFASVILGIFYYFCSNYSKNELYKRRIGDLSLRLCLILI